MELQMLEAKDVRGSAKTRAESAKANTAIAVDRALARALLVFAVVTALFVICTG